MAKLIRLMSVVALAAFLFSFLPAFASAQYVHEVRPAGADEIRIGVDGPASMEAVVALARRITGNPALTADDVIANVSHARRYVCRVGGRMVYFGPDPEYGGRCPEDGVRTDGTLRGAVYRIPREHGVVLPRAVPRRTRSPVTAPESDAVAQARIAEFELRLRAVTTERDEARTALSARVEHDREAEILVDEARRALEVERDTARRERDEARVALAARPVTAPTVVRVESAAPAPVTLESRLHGVPVWGWLVIAALIALALAFILFGLVFLPREKRPYAAYIDRLEKAKTKTEGEFMEERAETRTLRGDLEKELAKSQKLASKVESVRAAGKRAIRILVAVAKSHQELKEEHELHAQKVVEFQVRRDRIETNHAKLIELRDKEDAYDVHDLQIREAEDYLREAEVGGDEAHAEHCREIIRQNELELERKKRDPAYGDPQDIKAEIAGLVAMLTRDMKLQCGLDFDGRSSDEWKAEWELRKREELRRVEAAKRAYQALRVIVEEQGKAGVAELETLRRTLEETYAAKDGAFAGKAWLLAAGRHDAEEHLRLNERTLRKLRDDYARQTEELATLRAELEEHKELLGFAATDDPSSQVTALVAMTAQNADLKRRLRELGIDPDTEPKATPVWPEEAPTDQLPLPGSNGTPAMGVRRPRRVPTLTVGATPEAVQAQRDSQIPAPPSSPMSALNRDIYRFLDTLRSIPPESWMIDCNDEAGRDWAYLLYNCRISVPRIGSVSLRKYLAAVEKRAPDWFTERARRRTDPPPAPSAA